MTNHENSSARLEMGQHQHGKRRGSRALRSHAVAAASIVTLGLGFVVAAAPASSAASASVKTPALLQAANTTQYGEILTNSHGFSLYGLSDESGGKLACVGKCLQAWPPMLVATSVTKISLGPGVTGVIGFVKRSATTKQVTFDGFPVYTFIKGTAAGQAHGEGISAFGGTWGLLRASSLVTAAPAPAPTTTTTAPAPTGMTTTTTAAPTTTTTAQSAY